MEDSADEKIVETHMLALMQHFDNVQVLVTKQVKVKKPDGGYEMQTASIELGAGNVYARIGHAEDWLIKQREQTRLAIRAASEPGELI